MHLYILSLCSSQEQKALAGELVQESGITRLCAADYDDLFFMVLASPIWHRELQLLYEGFCQKVKEGVLLSCEKAIGTIYQIEAKEPVAFRSFFDLGFDCEWYHSQSNDPIFYLKTPFNYQFSPLEIATLASTDLILNWQVEFPVEAIGDHSPFH